ncbi:MAG: hypothetical protein ABSF36_07845 [Candidatus Methanomethylicaceae archaeon]|jgi:predicted DNA-binding ribbon-helix-helix protein
MPIRAFRIEEETINRLNKIAATEHNSINALVNSILDEYTGYIYPAKKSESKVLFGELFNKFIDEIDTKRLEIIALEIGERMFKEFHEEGLLSNNISSFKKFISEVPCNFANWASYYEDSSRNKLLIDLFHNMGLKWSLFLKNFFYWEITQLEDVDIADVNIMCKENHLSISFPKIKTNG